MRLDKWRYLLQIHTVFQIINLENKSTRTKKEVIKNRASN